MSVDKLPPQNVEAEQSVLGSLLLDRDAIIKVASFLQPDDFYREAHGQIYVGMLHLYERREPADLVTLCDELDRRGQLDSVGGPAYLTSLVNTVPTSAHVEHYGRIVERAALRRRLIDAAARIAEIAYDETSDEIDDVIDRAEQLVFGVAQRRLARELVPISKVLYDYFDRIEYLQQHQGSVLGIPTGFVDLDKLLGGFQPSDLIIVAGRPGMGKSSLTLSIAESIAAKGQGAVAIFSLEMSSEQLVQRLIAGETGIDSQRLRLGQLRDNEIDLVARAIGRLSEMPIYLDDSADISPFELRTKARRLHTEYPLSLVIVDYLQLMRSGVRSENRVQEISFISRSLKALARELRVPVMAASQLSRAVEARQDRRPQLADLRESGCLSRETLVYLPDQGIYRPIEQLVGQSGFRVLALSTETWRLEPCPVSRVFATGFKPVYHLKTRLGRSVRATANHKFLTIHGWRRLDELACGTRIGLPRWLPSPTQATMRDAELALLGHLIGDGCTLPRHAIQYTTRELALAETVANLATEIFGDAIKPRIRQERRWYQVYLAASQPLTHNTHNPITEWLEKLGVFGLRSHEKRVPNQVFAQPSASIAHFLHHLWATDGCIHLSHGKARYANIYYASSSAELARDVQSLLLRLGINAILSRHAQSGKGRDQYHAIVSGKLDIEGFVTQIGALGRDKTMHQAAIVDHLAQRSANTNRDILPREVWQLIAVPAMQAAGLTTRQTQARLGNAYCGTALYKANLSRERAARLAKVVGSEELAKLAQSDVYWDEIVAIEPDGETEV